MMLRRTLTFVACMAVPLLASAARCTSSGARGSHADSAGATTATLAGDWRSVDSNLVVTVHVSQQGDSISGTGSYTARAPAALGCGGETIDANGPVSLAGALTGRQVRARFTFSAAGWTPPYVATWIMPDTLRGGFMSIDRGQCSLTLVRTR